MSRPSTQPAADNPEREGFEESMVQAVIFDADGVLVNASELHFHALNRALATKGWCISRRDHENEYNGLPTRQKLLRLTAEKGFPLEWHEHVLNVKQQITKEVIREFLRPDESKLALLDLLKQDGLFLGVASNMAYEPLNSLLKAVGVFEYLDAVIGQEQVTHSKPHCEPYLTCATAMGVDISSCVIVVDNPISLQAARDADPLDIVTIESHEDVNVTLYPMITRFLPMNRAA